MIGLSATELQYHPDIAGGMFQVFVFGGGALSLDARLSRKEFQPARV